MLVCIDKHTFVCYNLRSMRGKKEIALIIDDTQQHYQLYESGKRELPMHLFIKLAKFYDVSLDYLAGLTNQKEKYW